MVAKPEGYGGMFTPAFLTAVPEEKLSALLASLYARNGKVERVTARSHVTANDGVYDFTFATSEARVTIGVESEAPHRIESLWIGPAVSTLRSFAEVTARLAALPGNVSCQLQRLDDGTILQSLNPERPLAIGSAFKMYVLATLMKQGVPWDRVITLDDRLRAFPSGETQRWPVGSPVTVHTLALKMISISDNTAADHLLRVAGRHAVEEMLPELGMASPASNVPFLSTLEMMRIKSDAKLLQKYLAADKPRRQALLDQLLDAPKPSVGDVDRAFKKPNAIDTVEWFASAADLCRLMNWFDHVNDKTALDILAMNPGVSSRPANIAYMGYKGGSETGVVNLTWLLHSRSGHRYAMSAGWNNPKGEVNTPELVGLMESAMNLIEAGEGPATKP